MKKLLIMGALCANVALTGCASMFGEPNNKSVKVTSNVDNGSTYVDGRYYGSTPTGEMVIPLDGGANHSVTLKKQNYRSVTMPVNRVVQGSYYLNIPLLFLFIIPGVVLINPLILVG